MWEQQRWWLSGSQLHFPVLKKYFFFKSVLVGKKLKMVIEEEKG